MKEMNISTQADNKAEETIQAAAAGEGNAKNKKKKEKAKAKAAALAKPDEEKPKEEKELTAEEKQAAVKAAMAKRGNIVKVTPNEKSNIASIGKAEKEKRGAKKGKVHGVIPMN